MDGSDWERVGVAEGDAMRCQEEDEETWSREGLWLDGWILDESTTGKTNRNEMEKILRIVDSDVANSVAKRRNRWQFFSVSHVSNVLSNIKR